MSERDDDLETQALEAVDMPTQAVDAVDVPTEALAAVDLPTSQPPASDVQTEALRSAALPDDPGGSITELIAGPLAAGAARAAALAAEHADEREPAIESRRARARAEASRRPGILVIVAIALGAVLVLAGLFLLGMRIPEWTAAPTAEPEPGESSATSAPVEPSATPTPEPSTAPPRPSAPAPPGVAEWTALAGGECLGEWVDPWQLEYTVVDCAEPHPAQLSWRGPISEDPAAAYPGEEALASQVAIVCGAPTAIDLAAAGAYADIQVQAAYPVSEEAWAAGERDWFCFVTRSSGEPLTGSVAPTG